MNLQPGFIDSENSGSRAGTEFEPEEVRAALREILAAKPFLMTRRCCDFLAFVVEQSLLGHGHELKERTIGINVFRRENNYDTGEDAIVRIMATETRKRLAAYYSECVRQPEIIISLPTGGYVPQFHRREGLSEIESPVAGRTSSVEATGQPRTKHLNSLLLRTLLLVLTVFISIGVYFAWRTGHRSAFQGFWMPVLSSSGPIFLVTSPAPVYVYYANGPQEKGSSGGHYVITNDQFIGRGDMLAGDQIFSFMHSLGTAGRLKPSDAINLREMSTHSVILIGYASTKWGALSDSLRYAIDDSNLGMITDHGKPTEWYPHHLAEDLSTDDDYALIARVNDPETRSVLLLLSGATQYGTEAAAAMVTNPDLLSYALKKFPQGCENKNLEIVIHVKVIGNTPAAPAIVAVDCR